MSCPSFFNALMQPGSHAPCPNTVLSTLNREIISAIFIFLFLFNLLIVADGTKLSRKEIYWRDGKLCFLKWIHRSQSLGVVASLHHFSSHCFKHLHYSWRALQSSITIASVENIVCVHFNLYKWNCARRQAFSHLCILLAVLPHTYTHVHTRLHTHTSVSWW